MMIGIHLVEPTAMVAEVPDTGNLAVALAVDVYTANVIAALIGATHVPEDKQDDNVNEQFMVATKLSDVYDALMAVLRTHDTSQGRAALRALVDSGQLNLA